MIIQWLKSMIIKFYYYIVLLFFFCTHAVIAVPAKAQAQSDAIEYHQNGSLDNYDQNEADKKQSLVYAKLVPGNMGNVKIMQTSSAAPFWMSTWFFILFTIIVGSILIYFYIEYDKKVVSVREENEA